jgi:4-amino-4-deoxy-L-arabinose transferase-like glycosyltransferase
MSGSVNPDSMMFAVAAAVFLCVARAFRRSFTRRLAVVLGILIAVGFMTKLNFVGFAFGVYVGLLVLAIREAKRRGRVALQAPLIAIVIGFLPVMLYLLRNVLANHPTLGIASRNPGLLHPTTLLDALAYTWQLYLPRIPGMPHYFEGISTFKDIWFDRSVGLYGWMDTMFPVWVDNVALVPAAVVALLFGRGVIQHRRALRRRLPEFGVYVAIVLGLLTLIGVWSYQSDVLEREPAFGEPRYLLPLLPLFGAVMTLAVRGAGRRWAPMVGAGLIVLVFGYDIVSQLQVIARYYG